MSTIRPVVNVYCASSHTVVGEAKVPEVFYTPIRNDLVQSVITRMVKNARQPYAVKEGAGYQTSAESWGTGRAVARIPRVAGGGTHRAGQAAFGNMCRGGGMFNPTKVWRRWGRRINKKEKRYAVCAAIAASGVPSLLSARGHRIEYLCEVPLVVDDKIESIKKTRDAAAFLKAVGLEDEMEKVIKSKNARAGKGKMRNRKYKTRVGPLVVYKNNNGIKKAFRNIPGVELCNVKKLNLLKLAPGSAVGRLIIWSEGAFNLLDTIYGKTYDEKITKKNYVLPKPLLQNADIYRIIHSDQVQSVLLPRRKGTKKRTQHKNALTNYAVRCRLNPAYKILRMAAIKNAQKCIKEREARALDKKKKREELKKVNSKYYKSIASAMKAKRKLEEKRAKDKKKENVDVANLATEE